MRNLRVTPQVLPDAREPTVPKGMLTSVLEEEELEISQKDIENICISFWRYLVGKEKEVSQDIRQEFC